MVITKKIQGYNLVIISNYAIGGGHQKGYVHLFGENSKYLGYFGIIKNGKSLPRNKQHPDGTLCIHIHESELEAIITTFKTQSPIFITFDTSTKWGSLVIGKYATSTNELAA
ncbi:hypothetical protein M0D21_14200 [Aquimarina sp. D1M17]|uniref:hypothetical protein n=1 Tax=Aquimarina acroporae TaxID=2937283 RepID=UPI0020C06663|nr:hypothetical protein [Aquimarina acroporae]MCK8522733.1 hypothetical protein [Aquimarina acroporae]